MRNLVIWLAALLLVGCNQHEEVDNNDKLGGKEYTASIDEQISRVYMEEDLSLHFNASDAITLFSTTKNRKFVFVGNQGDNSGKFAQEGSQDISGTPLDKVYAIYPYNRSTAINDQGVISTALSSEQSYVINSVARGANMMAAVTATAADTHLSFKNLCSYLCVELYGKDVTLRSIKLEANGGEKIAGTFSLSANGATPEVKASENAVPYITLTLGNGVALSDSAAKPTKFFFATLPTTLADGYTLTAQDSSGKTFVVVSEQPLTLERNEVQTVKAVEVIPIATEIKGLTAPKSIDLPAQSLNCPTYNFGSTTEDITLSTNEPWIGIVEKFKSVKLGESASVQVWSEPNFSTTERRATITITGVTSGAQIEVPVTQAPYFTSITEAFPARLELQSASCDTSKWASNGIVKPRNSSAVMSVVSTSGNKLTCTVSSGAKVANLGVGDYLLYAIPTKGVAAGEQIDFMCTLGPSDSTSPKYYIFEYWDDGEWKCVENSLRTAEDYSGLKYSLICRVMDESYNITFTQSFALSKPVVDDCVKVRIRVLTPGAGAIRVPSGNGYMGMYMINYPNAVPVVDSKRMLFIGNSFTYYFGTAFMFKEIARTEGHQVDAVIGVKGSQSFAEHIRLYMSLDAIKQGGYDYAFLQDTSPNPALYADTGSQAVLDACNTINNLTLAASPSCQIVYERTWAVSYENYRGYGSYDKLDYLIKTGLEMLQRDVDHKGIIVSPIGLGFRVAREQKINLLFTDNRHQSRAGAYMKACINYLYIYKTRFSANVSNCGVDAALAKTIRDIAERVVFEGVEEHYEFEKPKTEEAANCYIIDKAGQYSIRADVMGNGNIPAGSAITSAALNGKGAKVLWSSYNTTTAPASNDELISNVSYADGKITFTAGANGFKEGNAVIALYDDAACQGNILWSWHIWLCDDIKEQSYNNKVWLDRNLGALAAEAGNPLNIGFYYQFGRKDPFRGAAAINANTYVATTGTWPAVTATIPAQPEAYVIANPQQLIARNKDPRDWFTTDTATQNHALWNSGGKTMYDPCPLGYKVPGSYEWNVGQGAETSFFTNSNLTFDSTTYCATYKSGDTVVVYPIAGCTSGAGELSNVGVKGYYRATGNIETTKYGDVLELVLSGSVINPVQGNYRGSGYSVRCVKE